MAAPQKGRCLDQKRLIVPAQVRQVNDDLSSFATGIPNRALSTSDPRTLSHSSQTMDSFDVLRWRKAHAPIADFKMHTIFMPTKFDSHSVALAVLVGVRQSFLGYMVKRQFDIGCHSAQSLIPDELHLHIRPIFILNELLDGGHNAAIVENGRMNAVHDTTALIDRLF